jgi:inorganic pyrophosphatase
MDITKLPIGEGAPECVNALIEIPLGETNKYEFDKELGIFKLSRPLYASVHYPGDYGFIPSTLSEDGDALDILVLVDSPSFPGCLVTARPIAVLDMVDSGELDQKVLAVSSKSPTFASVTEKEHLPEHTLHEVEHFFTVYKQLERKKTEMRGWKGREDALEAIRECARQFHKTEKRA